MRKNCTYLILSMLLCVASFASAQYQARMVPPLELSLETSPALRFFPIDEEVIQSKIDDYGNGQLFVNLQVSNMESATRGRLVIQVLRKDGGVVASTTRSLELNQGETRVGARLYISPTDISPDSNFQMQLKLFGRDRKLSDSRTIAFNLE